MEKFLLRRCLNRVFSLLARFSPGATSLRPFLHRARGVKIGKHVFIGEDVYLDNEYPEGIEIQDYVQISIRTVVIAHTRGPGKVVIGKEAFIGPGCIIASSAGRVVKVGNGAVIGAGTILTKSVPPGLYLAPAQPLCLARADVPLTTSESMETFRAGLRPITRPTEAPRSSPDA